MDGYDYLNDYIGLWGICRYGTPMPVSLTFTPRGKLGQLVRSASVQNPVDGFEQQFKLTADDDTARNVCLTEEKCRKLLALAGTAEGSFSGSLHRDGTLYFCLLPYLCGMDAARGIQGSNRSAFYNWSQLPGFFMHSLLLRRIQETNHSSFLIQLRESLMITLCSSDRSGHPRRFL